MAQFLTLLERDLATIAKSWLVRGWLALATVSALLLVMGQANEGRPASVVATSVQAAYLFVWSIVIIVISGGAVASEAGSLADSVLSRPVKRWHYIVAKLTGRCLAVLAVFLLVSVPATYMAWRYATDADITLAGAALGTGCVALALLFLTSLGVGLSSVMRGSLVAIVALALGWYAIGSIFEFLEVAFLSPFALIEELPSALRGELASDLQWKIPVGFLAPTVAVWLATIAHFNYKDL